tara:strand:+ start:367 stop:843 length:477 start_codon:yes stop_codon:yes gene_type:complete
MATAKKVRNTSRAAKMRKYFAVNPTATTSEVAKKFGTTYQIAYMAKKSMDKMVSEAVYELTKGRKAQRESEWKSEWQNLGIVSTNTPITMEEPAADPVNHPAHYKVGGVETIDFIEAKGLTYHLGNAVKYISRADHKGNRKQDLEKAKWYLERAIAQL